MNEEKQNTAIANLRAKVSPYIVGVDMINVKVAQARHIIDAIDAKDAEIEALTKYITVILTTMKKEVLLSNNETFLFLLADMLEAANYAVDEEFGRLRGPVQDKG